MPSQTFLIRSHARTIYTHPVTFVCAECHSTTTREIYPGKMPTYCLSCRPRRKKSAQVESSKGMFHPTHHLISADGRKTEVCLEKSSNLGWSWVRTALDWFSGSSIIQYHPEKGIISHETPLEGYTLIPFQAEQKPQAKSSTSKSKSKSKGKETSTQDVSLENTAYSGRQMMKRLKCGDRLLRIKRDQPDFSAWSQERDPDGVAWEYKDEEFFPLEVTESEPEPKSSKKESESKPSKSKTKTKAKTPTKAKTQTKGKQSKKTSQKEKKEPVKAVKVEVQPLSGRQMMKRLKCGDRLLRIRRAQADFSEWSKGRDPDGIAWRYQDDKFVPNMG